MDKETIKKLEEDLDESVIKTRETDYGTVDYVKSSYSINRANEIFGFDGWSGQIVELKKLGESSFEVTKCSKCNKTIYGNKCNNHPNAKTYQSEMYHIMFKCIYQITVDNSTRQDVGFGDSTQGNKGSATETAIKSAVSDSVKRTLRHYGSQFGLSLYSEHQNTGSSTTNTSKSSNSTIKEVTVDNIKDKIQQNIDKYGTSKDISEKMHGAIKGFLNSIGIENEDRQHEAISKIIDRDISSINDLSYSEASPIISVIKESNKSKQKLVDILQDKKEDNNKKEEAIFDLIEEVKEKLEEKKVKNSKFINWIANKADEDFETFDQVPEGWLENVLEDNFWNKNEEEIRKFGCEELVEEVKDKIDKQTSIQESQLYTWFGKQDDKEYESLEEVPDYHLEESTKQDFWDENFDEIDDTIPF